MTDSPYREPHSQVDGALFEDNADWQKEWWGMPSYSTGDICPQRRVVLNFLTEADVEAFVKATGIRITPRTDSIWYPNQERLKGEWYYDGPPTESRYPVCVPSKGRAEIQTTKSTLARLGVSCRFFVEETEYDAYCRAVGEENVEELPFHDLGRGSIPARNYIWNWCQEREYKRHWVVDDNIGSFRRMTSNRRIAVKGGGFFRAMEDFVDRYENVAMAGPHEIGFVKDRQYHLPYHLNSRVYSCILLDTSLPYRWRGRYNEDTDLSLRFLKDGYCTLLFKSLLMHKNGTYKGDGDKSRSMPGGNTDTVYAVDDCRRAFALALQEQHPDCVEVIWKFGRWHHQVDYSKFKRNKLILRAGVTPIVGDNDYGMRLVHATGENSAENS